jgi:hypothetical protein
MHIFLVVGICGNGMWGLLFHFFLGRMPWKCTLTTRYPHYPANPSFRIVDGYGLFKKIDGYGHQLLLTTRFSKKIQFFFQITMVIGLLYKLSSDQKLFSQITISQRVL